MSHILGVAVDVIMHIFAPFSQFACVLMFRFPFKIKEIGNISSMHQRRVELPHMAPEAIALSVELLVQLQEL